VLLALGGALWAPRLRGPIDLRYDAGVYYVLGTSLAEGRGYRILSEPGALEAVQYPPLLPAIGALHERVLGTSNPAVVGHALRITMCLLFLGYVAAVFALSRLLLAPAYAFLATLLTTLHAQTIFMSDFFAADVPYAFVSVLFFVVTFRNGEGRPPDRVPAWGAVAGTLAVAAYAVRSAGLAMLGAWVAESLLHRRVRQAAVRGAVAMMALATWQLYTARVRTSPDYQRPAYSYQRADYQFYNVGYLDNMRYIDPFRPELGRASATGLAQRVMENVRRMPISFGEAVSLHRGWWIGEVEKLNQTVPGIGAPAWLADVALALLSIPVVAGLFLLAVDGYWLIGVYTAASVLLIALTPWPAQFSRYMVPLTPFLTLALVYLLSWTAGRLRRTPATRWRAMHAGLIVATGVILIQQAYTLYKSYTIHLEPAVYTDAKGRTREHRLFFYDRNWRLHDKALDWLATHARAGEVVATSTPHWASLRTGLPAVMPPYEANAATAARLMETVPVTYLIVDNLSFLDVGRRYARPVIEHAPQQWSLIYFADHSGPRIYRRRPAIDAGTKVVPSLGSK
jgi:hypothetical protein